MILANGLVMDDDFNLKHLDIQIAGGKIVKIAEKIQDTDDVLDMSGRYILPGFVDTHIHGAYGVRISDENPSLHEVTKFEASQGVTSIAITTAASEYNDILRQIDVAVATGIDQKTLSNYETGKTNPDSYALIRLADFFEVSIDYLVGRRDSAIPDSEKTEIQKHLESIRNNLTEISKYF